jgi:DNA-binding PadR family transcriptional regulator
MRKRRCFGQALALLRAFADRPLEWRHGYELAKATAIKSGTLYPILIRLSDRGLLETQWESVAQPGRPPRHLYRLTTSGVAYAEHELAACELRGAPAVKVSRA